MKAKLESEGGKPKHLGNQSSGDLELEDGIKIDVKTSTMKNEGFKEGHQYWGWALDQGKKKNRLNSDYYVCVALNDAYEAQAYYVIKAKDLSKFPPAPAQFSKVKRSLRLPTGRIQSVEQLISPRTSAKKRRELVRYYQRCLALQERQIVKKVSARARLSRLLV